MSYPVIAPIGQLSRPSLRSRQRTRLALPPFDTDTWVVTCRAFPGAQPTVKRNQGCNLCGQLVVLHDIFASLATETTTEAGVLQASRQGAVEGFGVAIVVEHTRVFMLDDVGMSRRIARHDGNALCHGFEYSIGTPFGLCALDQDVQRRQQHGCVGAIPKKADRVADSEPAALACQVSLVGTFTNDQTDEGRLPLPEERERLQQLFGGLVADKSATRAYYESRLRQTESSPGARSLQGNIGYFFCWNSIRHDGATLNGDAGCQGCPKLRLSHQDESIGSPGEPRFHGAGCPAFQARTCPKKGEAVWRVHRQHTGQRAGRNPTEGAGLETVCMHHIESSLQQESPYGAHAREIQKRLCATTHPRLAKSNAACLHPSQFVSVALGPSLRKEQSDIQSRGHLARKHVEQVRYHASFEGLSDVGDL